MEVEVEVESEFCSVAYDRASHVASGAKVNAGR